MPSFDVVNRIDFQEIDNAIGNATREITNRYDFKGSETSIERKDNDLTVITEDELKQVQSIVQDQLRQNIHPQMKDICHQKKHFNILKIKKSIMYLSTMQLGLISV